MVAAHLVSVIIPTYNRADLVQQAVESILAQTWDQYEIIVVDDGSTDDTEHALTRWHGRIRYERQENQGESAARNRGVQLARGAYVAFLDSDDLWLPGKLARQVEVLERNPAAGVVFCRASLIDGDGRRLPDNSIFDLDGLTQVSFEQLCRKSLFAPSTVVMRRAVFDAVGGFDEAIRYGEDWDLWLRSALVTSIVGLTDPLASIRLHQGGQWWFPRKERIGQVLEEHLRLLNNAFDHHPDQSLKMQALRAECLAREVGAAALARYAFDQRTDAQNQLREAIRLDPSHWADLDYVAAELIGFALRIGQMNPVDMQAPRRYLRAALLHLPPELAELAAAERRLAAKTDIELGYYFLSVGELQFARRYLLHGAITDLRWLRNRGLDKALLNLWLNRRQVARAAPITGDWSG